MKERQAVLDALAGVPDSEWLQLIKIVKTVNESFVLLMDDTDPMRTLDGAINDEIARLETR